MTISNHPPPMKLPDAVTLSTLLQHMTLAVCDLVTLTFDRLTSIQHGVLTACASALSILNFLVVVEL